MNRSTKDTRPNKVAIDENSERQHTQHDKADVLLVTATQVEARAVLMLFEQEFGHRFKRCFIDDKTYFDLGVISNTRTFIVRSEMGAVGPHQALLRGNYSRVLEGLLGKLEPSTVGT